MRLLLVLLSTLFVACSSSPEEGSDAGVTPPANEDAAVLADAAGFPDAAPVLDCVCDELEPCPECFAHIGECCYSDPTIGGRAELIADNCTKHAACKACCRECVEASCELIRATRSCPNDPK